IVAALVVLIVGDSGSAADQLGAGRNAAGRVGTARAASTGGIAHGCGAAVVESFVALIALTKGVGAADADTDSDAAAAAADVHGEIIRAAVGGVEVVGTVVTPGIAGSAALIGDGHAALVAKAVSIAAGFVLGQ